ncbi:MAG: hypothetical protein H7144_04635 [Burkholderiales bacterium]|nr:hypothetical protein [Phycisphaerae bacterium]
MNTVADNLSLPGAVTLLSQSLVPSIQELLTTDPDEFVARFPDIAAVNLACARGLPNCDESEFLKHMSLLDEMARAVAVETERFRPNFRPNPSCPTEASYCIYMLAKVCRDHFKLRHFMLPERGTGFTGILYDEVSKEQWSDSRNWFIHGLLGSGRIGSCTSLPVLYAAVGRRLGYPIKLVLALCHAFIRWDDGIERINLEATGPDYINSHPDGYYIDQPRPWTHHEKTCGYYLRSITPLEELAMMLSCRAVVLKYSGNLLDAGFAISKASVLAPNDPNYPKLGGQIELEIASLPLSRRPVPCFNQTLNIGFDGKRFFEPEQSLRPRPQMPSLSQVFSCSPAL